MSSRRRFLRLTGAAAGVAVAGVPSFAQQNESPSSVPPSIAALTSMKDQAKPITVDERKQRIEQARSLMRQNRLNAEIGRASCRERV